MSYSNAEIDLSGIHVACLIGENGAGKSSLLDAITWAIWEEGRARTDELIKLGQSEMSSEVDFYMEGNLYRVYRSRIRGFKSSQGKSNLEFQISSPQTNEWKSLTLSATRQTQELIIKTIKMDYSTFVNSVYLRQGKADEFTIKRPNERKQILADILGLEVYDRLCERARAKSTETEQKILLETGTVSSFKEKILKEDELKQKHSNISDELKTITAEVEKSKSILSVKEKELGEKQEKEKQVQTLEKSRQSQESLLNVLNEQIKNLKMKEEKCKELVNNKEKIIKEHDEFLKLKGLFESLELNKEKSNKLLLKKNEFENSLKERIKMAEQNLAVYKSKLSERESSKNTLSEKIKHENKFNQLIEASQSKIKSFKDLQEAARQTETEGLETKHSKELNEFEIKKVTDAKGEIIKKINQLKGHDHSSPCPLCKGPIQDKEKVIESYNRELKSFENKEKELNEKSNEIEKLLSEKRAYLVSLREKIKLVGKELLESVEELKKLSKIEIDLKSAEPKTINESLPLLNSRLEVSRSEFQKTKEQIAVLDKEISEFNKEIYSINTLITSGEHVKELTEKINLINLEIKNLNHDDLKYEKTRTLIKEKEQSVQSYNLLRQAESEFISIGTEINSMNKKVAGSRTELDELKSLIEANKKDVENLSVFRDEVSKLKDTLQQNELKFNAVRKELIVLEQQLNEIQTLKEQIKEREKEIESLHTSKKQYDILEKAFSKNGIQVAIIETIVPEIEKEANRILNRLTENQMHVALKTQRQKKSSEGLTETLDVVIADDQGTRNYELYSGGEAFKINFSLRLALSRLLANRSGAKLQTLIIDEGFGSQDAAGKERLLEIIRSIQNEFELILVVTHLDELKEAFPSQILVTKDEEGSKVRLAA